MWFLLISCLILGIFADEKQLLLNSNSLIGNPSSKQVTSHKKPKPINPGFQDLPILKFPDISNDPFSQLPLQDHPILKVPNEGKNIFGLSPEELKERNKKYEEERKKNEDLFESKDKKEEEEKIEGRGMLTMKTGYEHLSLKTCSEGCRDKRQMCQVIKKQEQCHKLSDRQLQKCACSCLKCHINTPRLWHDDLKKTEKTKTKGKLEFNSENCGLRYKKGISHIIGGRKARKDAWPWIVGLIKVDPKMSEAERLVQKTFCGGTLINPRTVLTAAHCFINIEGFVTEESLNVRIADLRLDHKDDGEEVVGVKKIITHQEWNTNTYEHDIALVILEKDLDTEMRSTINTACLPLSNDIPAEYCFVAGWGVQKEGSRKQAKHLMQIKIPLLSNKDCNRYFRGADMIKPGMMCAGNRRGSKDACQGDSGGPLVCRKDDKFELRGIISWGQGCGRRGKFGVYTNVWKYMDWVVEKMVSLE